MFHDLDQRPLPRLGNALGHVVDNRVFGQSGLEVHVRKALRA